MTKRTMIRVGSTITIFILFGLIGGIFLNTLLTSAANSPVVAPLSTPSADPTPEPATTPVVDPTSSDAATPTPTVPPVVATPTPAPTPGAQGKVIVVSLATQSLTAYENGKVVATTVVATGRPALPTLTGTFHIKAKYTPYQFISPWPKSSPYWYASAWVKYAMLYEDGGYFIHDAPWRTVYGPGANLTNGTHGCVNVPLSTMSFLYKWASVGTTVIVQ
ncbi:MAG: L,D-transpeptidase [Chloroflexi bacterium]|nr:MAG: L,D-transpeptidase [Chloroflexota bacterium]